MSINYIKRKLALRSLIKGLVLQGYEKYHCDGDTNNIIALYNPDHLYDYFSHILNGGNPPMIMINKKDLSFNSSWLSSRVSVNKEIIINYLYENHNVKFNEPLPNEALIKLGEYCNYSGLKENLEKRMSLKQLLQGNINSISLRELHNLGFFPDDYNLEKLIAYSIKNKIDVPIGRFCCCKYKCRLEVIIEIFTGKIIEIRTMPRISFSGFFKPKEEYKHRNYHHIYRINNNLVSKKVGQMYFISPGGNSDGEILKYQTDLTNCYKI